MSASLAVQQALVAALAGVAGVTGVYDGPALDAAAPYLVIGPDVMGDAGHSGGAAHDHRVAVTVWDDRPGVARLKQVLGAVEAAATGLAGVWAGHRIISARLLRQSLGSVQDGWRPGLIELRIMTEAV
ncbi:MAG: DUF3168 domain-containing protein [Alphaproteobacteria bacterium]|nr:DUF3168 domain-containing protein [Alphaproteobacteria bacterium]